MGDIMFSFIKKKCNDFRLFEVKKISRMHLTSRNLTLLENFQNELFAEIILRKPSHLEMFFLTSQKDQQLLKQFLTLCGFTRLKETSLERLTNYHVLMVKTFKGRKHQILNKDYYSRLLDLKSIDPIVTLFRIFDSNFKNSSRKRPEQDTSFLNYMITSISDIPELLIYQLCVKPDKKLSKHHYNRLKLKKNELIRDIQHPNIHKTQLYEIYQAWGAFRIDLRMVIIDKSKSTIEKLVSQVLALAASYGMEMKVSPRFLGFLTYSKKLKRALTFSKHPTIPLSGFELINLLYPPNSKNLVSYDFITEDVDYELPKIPNEFFNGDLFIGYQFSDDLDQKIPLFFSWKHINTHMSIFGMTGEGKTHLASNILCQAILKEVKCIIFDPKGEYHLALSKIEKVGDDLIYFRPGNAKHPLHLNLFEIPKDENGNFIMNPEEHQAFLIPAIESMIEKQEDILSPQMRHLLYKAIEWTITNNGNLTSFLEVLEMPHLLGLQGNYIENSGLALINRFAKFTFGTGKSIFQCRHSNISPQVLLKKNVIIDLSMLEAREDLQFRTLLINYIMHVLFHYLRRNRNPVRTSEKPTNIILIDEIQKILPFSGSYQFSVAGQSPWTLRSYGISMIFVGTDPFVEKPILTNTGISIVFFSKAPPKSMAMLLGISIADYNKLKTFFKHTDTKYNALVSHRGKIFILTIPHTFEHS